MRDVDVIFLKELSVCFDEVRIGNRLGFWNVEFLCEYLR